MTTTIDQLLPLRDALEREGQELAGKLRLAIARTLEDHRARYGWTPDRISVAMIEATTLNDRLPQYRVGEVSVGTPAGITSGRGWPIPPPPPILETKVDTDD